MTSRIASADQIGPSFLHPEEPKVWDQWQCPAVDSEIAEHGSPLLTVPTPGRTTTAAGASSRRESHASAITDSSVGLHQRVRVVVRVRPLVADAGGCLECDNDNIRITPPADEAGRPPPQTPGRVAAPTTPGRTPARTPGGVKTPGRTPSGAKTPGRTPGGVKTPGRTPGGGLKTPGRTPGRTTPGARTPGGPKTPGRTPHGPRTPGRTPAGRTPGRTARAAAPKSFSFDGVCDVDASQADVFTEARPLVDSALSGANTCVFAYGQTGSGKTHTMIGTDAEPGIVPRAIERVWDAIASTPGVEWEVRVTFIELYNDGWRDLLAASSQPGQRLLPAEAARIRKQQSAIHLRESHHGGTRGQPQQAHLEGSETFRMLVTSREQLQELIAYGNAARSTGSTNLNDRSSRSHAVLTLNLDSWPVEGQPGEARSGKLHLVDLAGSEALTTGSDSVLSAETRAINVSLTALCDCLQALSKNARRPRGALPQPVPFRNHKLTRLLADSLGGSSTTLMIAAVQASAYNYRSTLTTLKFASRARDITTHMSLGNDGSGAAADVAGLKVKISELQGRLRRREEEIERLESLNTAREAMEAREHARRVVELEGAKATELAALHEQHEESSALASECAAAERAYEVVGVEIAMLMKASLGRETMLALHNTTFELEQVRRRADTAESSLALTAAQRDDFLANSEKGAAQLEDMGESWRADRDALVAANARIVELEAALKKKEQQDAANAQAAHGGKRRNKADADTAAEADQAEAAAPAARATKRAKSVAPATSAVQPEPVDAGTSEGDVVQEEAAPSARGRRKAGDRSSRSHEVNTLESARDVARRANKAAEAAKPVNTVAEESGASQKAAGRSKGAAQRKAAAAAEVYTPQYSALAAMEEQAQDEEVQDDEMQEVEEAPPRAQTNAKRGAAASRKTQGTKRQERATKATGAKVTSDDDDDDDDSASDDEDVPLASRRGAKRGRSAAQQAPTRGGVSSRGRAVAKPSVYVESSDDDVSEAENSPRQKPVGKSRGAGKAKAAVSKAAGKVRKAAAMLAESPSPLLPAKLVQPEAQKKRPLYNASKLVKGKAAPTFLISINDIPM